MAIDCWINFNTISPVKPWFLSGFSTIGMLTFAALYWFFPRTVLQTQVLTSTVTNEVIKEVPATVPRAVKVSAEIPGEYIQAMQIYQAMTNATLVPMGLALFNLTDVQIQIDMSDDVQTAVVEGELRARFETGLRSNNIPISPNSRHILELHVAGALDAATHTLLHYDVYCEFWDTQWIFRGGECRSANVIVWRKPAWLGIAEKNRANVSLLELAEREGEIFASDYVTANPGRK